MGGGGHVGLLLVPYRVRTGELPDSRPLHGGSSGIGCAGAVARGLGRGWRLPAGGGDAVEEAVKSPEVLLGGDVTGPDGGRGGGSGEPVGRCRGEGEAPGGDAL